MRVVVVVVAFLASIVGQAQSWELGSFEPVPNSRRLSDLKAAASMHGQLLTWHEEYGGLFAARISSDGRVLDPLGISLYRNWTKKPRLVASDGEDYLVAWESDGIQTRRITASGEVVPNGWSLSGRLVALASNGRTYLLVYSRVTPSLRHEAVLLDRSGVPITGTLVLPATEDHSLVSSRGKWLFACRLPDAGETMIVEIGETDFPPYSQTRAFELRSILPPNPERPSRFRLAAGARGFAIAWIEDTGWGSSEIVVERHDADPREVERDVVRERSRIGDRAAISRHRIGVDIDELQLVLDGQVVYVVFDKFKHALYEPWQAAGIVRLVRSRAEEINLPARRNLRLSISHGGRAAFWVDTNDGQIYAARITASGMPDSAQHVSRTLPHQSSPALVSGAGMHLALWKEWGRGGRIAYAVLADDGTPRTPSLTLTRPHAEYLAASEGTSFLVVWADRGLHGSIIAPDGAIIRGPFAISADEGDHDSDSLVWDGASYVLSEGGVMTRIARDGAVLERITLNEADESAFGTRLILHPTEEGLLAILDESYAPRCTCGVTGRMRVIPLDRDLRPDPSRPEIWRDRSWDWWSWTGLAATAAGGGHRFLIRDDAEADEGLHVAGDDGRFRVTPYAGGSALSAMWDGQEFLVTTGEQLVRHAPDGAYRNRTVLSPGTIQSAVAVDRNRVPIVLMERFVGTTPRLLLMRLQTASPESAPAPH